MFTVRSVLSISSTAFRQTQSRGVTKVSHVIAGRSRVHIPFPEKLTHGVLIAFGVCSYPVWVLTHLRDYQER